MHIDYEDLEEQYGGASVNEPMRRNTSPVNGHHDLLRRTECSINRHRRQARKAKTQAQSE